MDSNSIEVLQTRLGLQVLSLNQRRNALQSSEALVRKKFVALMRKQEMILGTDRSDNRQQSIELQVTKQHLIEEERDIRNQLDQLAGDEALLLRDFHALADRERAVKARQMEEQLQHQEDGGERQKQHQKQHQPHHLRQQQPNNRTLTKQTAKKKNTHQSNSAHDGCSICLTPVRSIRCNNFSF